MSIELSRHSRNNSSPDSTMRTGEPMSGIPAEQVDAYKEALKKLGVDEASIERCAHYMTDSLARAQRSQLDNTVTTEPVDETAIDEQASTTRRAISALGSPEIFVSRSVRNQEYALRTLQDPVGTALQAIEKITSLTGIKIYSRGELKTAHKR